MKTETFRRYSLPINRFPFGDLFQMSQSKRKTGGTTSTPVPNPSPITGVFLLCSFACWELCDFINGYCYYSFVHVKQFKKKQAFKTAVFICI